MLVPNLLDQASVSVSAQHIQVSWTAIRKKVDQIYYEVAHNKALHT